MNQGTPGRTSEGFLGEILVRFFGEIPEGIFGTLLGIAEKKLLKGSQK